MCIQEEEGVDEPDWDAESSSNSAPSIEGVDGCDLDDIQNMIIRAKMIEDHSKNAQSSKGKFTIPAERRLEGWYLDGNDTPQRLSARDRKNGWYVNDFFLSEPTDEEDKNPDFMADFERWASDQLGDDTEKEMAPFSSYEHGPSAVPTEDKCNLYPRKPQMAIQQAGSVLASASSEPTRVGELLPPEERQTGPQGKYPIQPNTIHQIKAESLKKWEDVEKWLQYSKKSCQSTMWATENWQSTTHSTKTARSS